MGKTVLLAPKLPFSELPSSLAIIGGTDWTGLLDVHPCNVMLGDDWIGFKLFELELEAYPESLESPFSLRF